MVVVAAACSSPSEKGDLVRRLAGVDVPPRFAFDYSSAGTEVLGCALPNRRFTVVVDRTEGVVAVRDGTGELLVVSGPDQITVAGTQFASSTLNGAWVRAATPLDPERSELLRRVLGVDAASYALADTVPDDGQATAVELVESATTLSVVRREDDGAAVWRVDVAADEEAGAPAVRAEIAVTGEGRVVRIDVLPSQPARPSDDAATGWTVEYDEAEPAPVAVPAATTIDLRALPASELAPRPVGGCELGVGAPSPTPTRSDAGDADRYGTG